MARRANSPRSAAAPQRRSVHDEVVYANDHHKIPGRRYGYAVPRVFTPPLRELTPETSWGFSVVQFADDILEVTLMPWQRWLLIHMLELLPDGSLRFQTAIVLVARQNGKSTLSQVLALWFMLVQGWPLVLGTAQDLGTAEEVWEGAVGLLEDDADLDALIDRVNKVNGKKFLKLKTGERYMVKAANRGAGRGLSGNLILLDELREQKNWDAWGAITKTTQAQEHSLVLGMSNAGDLLSVVLRYLRLMAHKAVGDPDGINRDNLTAEPTQDDVAEGEDAEDLEAEEDSLFLAEWSAPAGVDRRDRDAWAQANPALGWKIREKKLAADVRTDPEWVFRPEVLCQWSDSILDGPFPAGAWEEGRNTPELADDGVTQRAAAADRITSKLDLCIDQSHDRSWIWIAAAGTRPDGKDQVEIVARLHDAAAVRDWLLAPERRKRIRRITGQTTGAPVSGLIAELKADRKVPFEIVDWQGGRLMDATGVMFDAVRDATARHNVQPPLDAAAATAVMKAMGGGSVIDRRASPGDAAPLVAFCGALWLLRQRKPDPVPLAPPPKTVRSTASTPTGLRRSSSTNLHSGNVRTVGF